MTCAEEVQGWINAVQLYESGLNIEAVETFKTMAPNSKIMFNIGCCYLNIGDSVIARQKFEEAIKMDNHLAIAYFMIAKILYDEHRLSEALEIYESALKKLRGNRLVDYRPLGLNYQLYASEIFANQGIVSYKLNQDSSFYFIKATKFAIEKRHKHLDEILHELKMGKDTTSLFSMPLSKLFKPSQSFVSNAKKKNYLGEAQVISTENDEKIYACFSGIKSNMQLKKIRKSPCKPPPPPKLPPPSRPPPPSKEKLLKSSPMPLKKPSPPKRPETFPKKYGLQPRKTESARTVLSDIGCTNCDDVSITEKNKTDLNFNKNAILLLKETLDSIPSPPYPLNKKINKSYSLSAPRKRLPAFTANMAADNVSNKTFPRSTKPRKPLPKFE